MGVTCVTSISKRCNADVTQPIFSVTRVTPPLHHVTHTKLHTKKRKHGTPVTRLHENRGIPTFQGLNCQDGTFTPHTHLIHSTPLSPHQHTPHTQHTQAQAAQRKRTAQRKTNSANIRAQPFAWATFAASVPRLTYCSAARKRLRCKSL